VGGVPDSSAAARELELRACRLPGDRWALVAREVISLADRILAAECARLRSRVAALEERLRVAINERELFRVRLNEEVERAARRADPVSVMRLELHDLPAYGQRFGSEAIDTVLGTVDQSLRRDVRAGDFLARWDPQGFALLLPNTDAQAARLVAERHQRAVGAIRWPHDDIDVRVGTATLWRDANDPDELLRQSHPVH
jgi:diguanylate cyclase (GGDEF)-like protein